MNNWLKRIFARKLYSSDNANNINKSEEQENDRVTIGLGFPTIPLPTTSPVKAISTQPIREKGDPQMCRYRENYFKCELILLLLLIISPQVYIMPWYIKECYLCILKVWRQLE